MENIRAKKSLGQNFLTDSAVLWKIVEAAEITSEDHVLEIGPGLGALTRRLLEHSRHVVAVELDHELVERLQEQFVESHKLSLLEGNILELDINERLRSLGYGDGGYKVVANIPYYITAPIIKMLLSLSVRPASIVLMVQNEVAERIVAAPGKMSVLSVMAQYYADAEKLFFVSRESFDPVPEVDSAVIKLIPKRRFDADEDRKLFRVVRAGFAARRKTLANNLSSSFHMSSEDAEALLKQCGEQVRVRAQELSLETWMALAERIQ